MKKAILFTFFAVAVFLTGTVNVSAQTSVAGEWDGSFNTPGGPRPLKLVFKVEGEKLSGTVKRSSGDLPLAGTIKGTAITFEYTVNYNGNALTLSFSGTVAGDNMSGTISFAGQAEESWSAKRTPPPADKPKSN